MSEVCKSNQLTCQARAFLREWRKKNLNKWLCSFKFQLLSSGFDTGKCEHKIEAIQKLALRFMLNGYESSYEGLLKISGKASMNLKRIGHYT